MAKKTFWIMTEDSYGQRDGGVAKIEIDESLVKKENGRLWYKWHILFDNWFDAEKAASRLD